MKAATVLAEPIPVLAIICLGLLAGLLLVIAVGDIRRRRIPNRLCAVVALLALPYWVAAVPAPYELIAEQAVLALAVGGVLAMLFAFGIVGGGDVKLLAALMLWVRPSEVPLMLMATALGGGLLGIVEIVAARLRGRPTSSVPYGVAIAMGALLVLQGRAPIFAAARAAPSSMICPKVAPAVAPEPCAVPDLPSSRARMAHGAGVSSIRPLRPRHQS